MTGRRPEAGEGFSTRGRTVCEADIHAFAALTGDTHPQHTDAVWAAGSRFGERVAHGLMVLSYATGLVPFDPDRVVALRRVKDAIFKRPVRIGDTIHAEGEIGEVRELDGELGLVEVRLRVLNQRGKLVMRAVLELIWRGEPAPDPADPVATPEPVLL